MVLRQSTLDVKTACISVRSPTRPALGAPNSLGLLRDDHFGDEARLGALRNEADFGEGFG
jgi:hypothetical protein